MPSGKPIVVLENLTYFYPGAEEPAITDINLEIREGEYVVLAGPSGGGKSTLCRVLNGLIPHFYGGRLEGRAVVCGLDVKTTPISELARHVGLVFQNPANQVVNLTVEEELVFGLENLALPPEVMEERVSWVLKALGIEHLRDRLTYALSGGELQKVALASVLVMKPEILVLDEVTANMDPYSARRFLELLNDVRRNYQVTVILVEHRLTEALEFADKLVLLDRTIVAQGTPRELLREGILEDLGVEEPPVARLSKMLGVNEVPLSVEECAHVLGRWLPRRA